jgi:hypothetical protein
LEQDKQCRNSDSILYLKVLTTVAEQKGIALDSVSIPRFLMEHHGTNFPIFESVRRARQKLQARYPELAACETVEGFRAENELQYKAYAVGDV